MKTDIRRRDRRGFSLSEVTCALGLLAIAMLPLLGVLAVGMDDARTAAGKRELGAMRTTIRQMLKGGQWPAEGLKGGAWTATCDFDLIGNPMVGAAATGPAFVTVAMQGGESPGFQSEFLETVRLVFTVPGSDTRLGECVIQRTRKAPAP